MTSMLDLQAQCDRLTGRLSRQGQQVADLKLRAEKAERAERELKKCNAALQRQIAEMKSR